MKDISYLKEHGVDVNSSLELFGDIDTYNETLIEFKNGIDGKLEQIDKFFKDQDMPNYAIYVHSLKSDCKYFGFLKLAEIAYVKDSYESLLEEAANVKKIVNEYLGGTESIYQDKETSHKDIILVADDSEVIRIFVKKIFNEEYDLAFAKDGEETLNIIKSHENDNRLKAILLDLNMPKVDGFAVLDYMKENNLLSKMPVTIVSGDSSSEAINKAFTYDIVDMLNKPFSEAKIKEVVEKTINNE